MRRDYFQGLSAGGFHRVAYTEWGSPREQRVAMCVHGLTRNGRDFDVLARALQRRRRVVCPDIVGRGRSDWLTDKSQYTFITYCADMTALLARVRGTSVDWIGTAERALRADPTNTRALSLSSGSLVVLGRIDEARDWTRRAQALEPNEPYVHYNAASVLAQLGHVEEALPALESGTENGRLCRSSWVEHDEDLASLRDQPRFQALLATMRAR